METVEQPQPVQPRSEKITNEAIISCGNVNRHVRSNRFWFYVLALIIVIVISWYLMIVRRQDGWYNSLNRTWNVPPIEVFMLGSALLLIMTAYITYVIDAVGDQKYKSWINLSFFLIALFFLIWAILLFGQQNIRTAFIFSILIFLVLLWHCYVVWQTEKSLILPEIIILIGSIVLICANWNLMQNNP